MNQITKKLYEENAYLTEFEAVVTQCGEDKKIVLDQTAFYPEGGGQPADDGWLTAGEKSIKIMDVHEKAGIIYHLADTSLEPGTHIHGKIRWERRFEHMQQHSGEHIVSGLIHHHFGYDNVGFHMGKDAVTIDFNGSITEDELNEIERKANQYIWNNTAVQITFPTEQELKKLDYRSKKKLEGQVRILTFPEADCCACCGTHVSHAGEIGMVKLLSSISYKGGTRICMLSGKRAMEDYADKHRQISAISCLLSAKQTEAASAVERLKTEKADLESRFVGLQHQLIEEWVKQVPKDREKLCLFREGQSPILLRKFCNLLCERAECVLVCSGDDQAGYKYVLGSKYGDVTILNRKLIDQCNAKGGGGLQMVQGTIKAEKQKIESVFSMES